MTVFTLGVRTLYISRLVLLHQALSAAPASDIDPASVPTLQVLWEGYVKGMKRTTFSIDRDLHIASGLILIAVVGACIPP